MTESKRTLHVEHIRLLRGDGSVRPEDDIPYDHSHVIPDLVTQTEAEILSHKRGFEETVARIGQKLQTHEIDPEIQAPHYDKPGDELELLRPGAADMLQALKMMRLYGDQKTQLYVDRNVNTATFDDGPWDGEGDRFVPFNPKIHNRFGYKLFDRGILDHVEDGQVAPKYLEAYYEGRVNDLSKTHILESCDAFLAGARKDMKNAPERHFIETLQQQVTRGFVRKL